MIDQFGRKRWQKKRKSLGNKLLWEFPQKYIVVHELQAGSFILNGFVFFQLYYPQY